MPENPDGIRGCSVCVADLRTANLQAHVFYVDPQGLSSTAYIQRVEVLFDSAGTVKNHYNAALGPTNYLMTESPPHRLHRALTAASAPNVIGTSVYDVQFVLRVPGLVDEFRRKCVRLVGPLGNVQLTNPNCSN